MAANCIFCKIIKGEIPSFKLYETEKTLAFMDIQPLSKGHALIVPKYHAERLPEVPDEHLTELLPIAKKLAKAIDAENYNILQNNGKLANQEVGHVHVHIIPKPNRTEGLGIGWPKQSVEMDELKALAEQIKERI
ncbi:Adenosine 5'-monophosphoramidase [Cytospora paraplurivora]|uniref:Adenosine 5'-monophosphoramidase n=1 Tax=Cytospora paraplurivora TaxID=2898453 RepID=A0AAN9UDX9_9PEZI